MSLLKEMITYYSYHIYEQSKTIPKQWCNLKVNKREREHLKT